MPITLTQLAEKAQDLYYQDYAPRDSFFSEDDFKFHAATYYAKALNDLYQAERALNKREEGFSNIEIPAAWLITEKIKLKYDDAQNRWIAKTQFPIFAFNFDGSANALQGVHSVGGKHIVYRKISLNDRRFRQVLPTINKILYFVNGPQEIVLWGGNDDAEIEAQYVPAITVDDDNCQLSENIAADVIRNTLTLMFGAKSGNIVQEANDGNKNITQQNQQNPTLTQAQTQ